MSSALERMIAESKKNEAAKAAQQAARDKIFKDAADAAAAKDEAEKAEQQKRRDADKAVREEKFDAELEDEARQLFNTGNAGASDAVWQSVRDEYRKKVLLRRSEQEAQRGIPSLYRKVW